uniref:hypothetical protein n=1 Tax=Salmonella sp. s55044 TaxID=3159677 RepID=UPI00397FC514
PADAAINQAPDECPETEQTSYIELIWNIDGHEWTLGLSFEVMDADYTMVLANGSYSEDGENGTVIINEWEDKNFEFASAPVGNSLHCSGVTLDHVEFVEYKFQPFAQKSNRKFGEVVECDEDTGMSTMWIIIIAAVGGAILIFVIIFATCACKKKKDSYESV